MDRKELLSGIFSQFENSARAFCADTKGIYCEIANEYKSGKKLQNLKRKTAKIYYNAFTIEFIYTAHGTMSIINSILSCNVYLDKAETSAGIPLPLFADYCDKDVKVPLCIPFITNEQGMRQAFDCIGNEVKDLLPALIKMCGDSEQLEKLRRKYSEELQYVCQLEVQDLTFDQLRPFVDLFTERFSTGPFHAALRGDYGKASKQLAKTKRLTGYEKRMLRLWLKQGAKLLAELSAVTQNAKAFSGYGTSKLERKEFAAVAVAWLVLCPVFTLLYAGLYALLVWIASWNAVFLLGPSYNYPYCFVAGFITSIAVSYFTRFFFFKRLFKREYAQYCEMEYTTNMEGYHKLMKGFLIVVAVGCVVLLVLMANWNLKFMQGGFIDNTEFFSLGGTYYSYDDVSYVYYKPNRVNGYGETLDYPSYVIVLNGGREIDLYEHGELTDYSGELLDFLRKIGIELKE
jgi:hypothetical protein